MCYWIEDLNYSTLNSSVAEVRKWYLLKWTSNLDFDKEGCVIQVKWTKALC